MLQTIKKFFSVEKRKVKKNGKGKKSAWAEKQIREMAKLGGKLVL